MSSVRRMIPVVLAAVVLSTSCGSEVGNDGLPRHCDRRSVTVIDGNSFATDQQLPFEGAVDSQLSRLLPKLRVTFSSARADRRSDGSDRVHRLSVSGTDDGRQATLKNDNGVQMLKATASFHDGTWVVDSVELCESMTKQFGPG